jgi:riboflavin synthase
MAMFTGLVQSTARIVSVTPSPAGARLTLTGADLHGPVRPGDSVCVSGVCLTAVEIDGDRLSFDVIPQTLDLTKLGRLKEGDPVNLESAVAAGQPMGGHFMQGHVDSVGEVSKLDTTDGQWRVWIQPGEAAMNYLTPQGSVALDGVSLTLASVGEAHFEVALIPETLDRTTLADLSIGSAVNIEVDMIAKTVVHQLKRALKSPEDAEPITMKTLEAAGFYQP